MAIIAAAEALRRRCREPCPDCRGNCMHDIPTHVTIIGKDCRLDDRHVCPSDHRWPKLVDRDPGPAIR